MLKKVTTLGTSVVLAMSATALANAGPPLPWREPIPLQVSLVGLLFVLSTGVALSGWWLLRRVERTTRRQIAASAAEVSGTRGKAA
jgi:membrane protein implicated in regulation of membrane protease activity